MLRYVGATVAKNFCAPADTVSGTKQNGRRTSAPLWGGVHAGLAAAATATAAARAPSSNGAVAARAKLAATRMQRDCRVDFAFNFIETPAGSVSAVARLRMSIVFGAD
jgi:hypothetical protein